MRNSKTNPRVYDIGKRLELRATITDPASGQPFDPAKVVCTFKDGDGATTTPEVTNPKTGLFVAFGTVTSFGSNGKGGYAFDAFDEDDQPLGAEEVEFRIRERVVPR